MIYLLIYGAVVFVVLAVLVVVLSSLLTGKTIEHEVAEIRSLIAYNVLGMEGVIDDMLSRHSNKFDPIAKTGKMAVITGGTRGIGAEVIKLLLQCDMKVIMGCRKVAAGEKVFAQIRADGVTTGEFKVFALDTCDNASVREFAADVLRHCTHVNYLINNAAIMMAPYKESPDGYESQFATNYLGHFLLTHLLFPLLRRGGTPEENARVVNVSSCAYAYGKYDFSDINNKKHFVTAESYATSKLAQLQFSTHLNKLTQNDGQNIQVHAVHPGVVNTGLFEHSFIGKHCEWLMKLFFKAPIEGAYPIVYAAIAPQLEGEGGTYITNCRITETVAKAKDPRMEEKLFDFTKEILKISEFGKDVE